MLRLLADRASQRPKVRQIQVNLYSASEEALGCYLKAGFELVGTSPWTMGLKLVRLVS
jgi:hypothetical protein